MPYFEVCTPRFTRAVIHLAAPHTGTQFVINAPAATSANEYIQSATLNEKALDKPWFAESELLSGGTWNVRVGPQPNKSWGVSPYDRPYSLSSGFTHSPPNPSRFPLIPTGQESAVEWHYTTNAPADDWVKPGFDDSGWKRGPAGFGTDDEGVTPRTAWNTDGIWMRRTITMAALYPAVELTAYHDQDLDVYFNGVLAAHVAGWTHSYDPVPVDAKAAATLHPGTNVIAVHVRHGGEGRHFADIGLYGLEWPDSEK